MMVLLCSNKQRENPMKQLNYFQFIEHIYKSIINNNPNYPDIEYVLDTATLGQESIIIMNTGVISETPLMQIELNELFDEYQNDNNLDTILMNLYKEIAECITHINEFILPVTDEKQTLLDKVIPCFIEKDKMDILNNIPHDKICDLNVAYKVIHKLETVEGRTYAQAQIVTNSIIKRLGISKGDINIAAYKNMFAKYPPELKSANNILNKLFKDDIEKNIINRIISKKNNDMFQVYLLTDPFHYNGSIYVSYSKFFNKFASDAKCNFIFRVISRDSAFLIKDNFTNDIERKDCIKKFIQISDVFALNNKNISSNVYIYDRFKDQISIMN